MISAETDRFVTAITLTSQLRVELVKTDFSDEWPCFSAWTSTRGEEATPQARAGLINRLIKDRHGTPFEHMDITFRVTAPIFVWREHHRHRMASYNEESGRYKKLSPVFYVPDDLRPLQAVPGTKQMDYVVAPGTADQYLLVEGAFRAACESSYRQYEAMLDAGILREVARMVLPVSIMSTCIVKMNARSLMNFLSLRVDSPDSKFPSKPMREINYIADSYEHHFAQYAPMTHQAFVSAGRVAP
jgi:thymidylate synthase (FAD)